MSSFRLPLTAFPGARLRIRLDGGFSGPELFAFFEAERLEYVVGMAKNPKLECLAEPLMAQVRSDVEAGHTSARRYGEFACRARSWPHERRVIVKAEVSTHFGRKPKDNPRFLITNLKTTPKHVYERVYCARGDAENRLKELKLGLEIDRTSCTRFLANQFRLLLASLAYTPIEAIRRIGLKGTALAHAYVGTIRLKLLKIGAVILSNTSRVQFLLASTCPNQDLYFLVARRLAGG